MGLVAKHWCEWRQVDPSLASASGRDTWTYQESCKFDDDELFHETLQPINDSSFPRNFISIPRNSDGQPLAMNQTPPSSLIVWHSNGRGAWVRDLEIISLPDMLYHFRHERTAAALHQQWLRMPIVSRRSHPNRASQGRAHQAWEPHQAQGSSSSAPKAIVQPMASGNDQPMAIRATAHPLGSMSKWPGTNTGTGQSQTAVPPLTPAPPRPPPRHPPPPVPPPPRRSMPVEEVGQEHSGQPKSLVCPVSMDDDSRKKKRKWESVELDSSPSPSL